MCYFLPRPQHSQSPVNTAGPGGPPLDLCFPSSLTRRAPKALRGSHKHFHSKFKSVNPTHLLATAGNPNPSPNPNPTQPAAPSPSSSSPPRASAAPQGCRLESWLQLLAGGANLHSSIQNRAAASGSGHLITPQLTQSLALSNYSCCSPHTWEDPGRAQRPGVCQQHQLWVSLCLSFEVSELSLTCWQLPLLFPARCSPP